MDNRFNYLPEIYWNKKTKEISFIDARGTHWKGYGHIQIHGNKVTITAEIEGITNDSTVL